MRMIKRGMIFYVARIAGEEATGSEQAAGRPAIIVSNDVNNAHSSVVEVVYLTTQKKVDLPTHVQLQSSGRSSTAICEQIHAVSVEKLGTYIGTCTEDEMIRIDNALAISIGLLDPNELEEANGEPFEDDEELRDLYRKLIETEAQAKAYKEAFYDLMRSMSAEK